MATPIDVVVFMS